MRLFLPLLIIAALLTAGCGVKGDPTPYIVTNPPEPVAQPVVEPTPTPTPTPEPEPTPDPVRKKTKSKSTKRKK